MCTFNLTTNDALVEAITMTSPSNEHSAWVQSMAKYRCLASMDEKATKLESLDERFG